MSTDPGFIAQMESTRAYNAKSAARAALAERALAACVAYGKESTSEQECNEMLNTLVDAAEQIATLQAACERHTASWQREQDINEQTIAALTAERAKLLDDPRAGEDLDRVRDLFAELERSENLLNVLDTARDAEGVRLFIGSENPLFSLSGSAMIVAPYMNAERKIVGALGVIGPTRLNYARVIPMVDYTAQVVGRILGEGRGTGKRE
jgi:transcriptional regulator of heat shock response